MGRHKTSEEERNLFGARFNNCYQKWKKENYGGNKTRFGKLLFPPVKRGTVENWCTGKNIPPDDKKRQICKIFGVPDTYFDIGKATHDERYKYSSDYITKIGKATIESANEEGLEMSLVEALSKIISFDNLFPIYSPIKNRKVININGTPTVVYSRLQNADSASIDDKLQFLQVYRDGRKLTLHKADLVFLKEVQDKIADYVKFLFYSRSQEMEEEVKVFNDDLYIHLEDGGIAIKNVDDEYQLNHDRFYKYVLDDYKIGRGALPISEFWDWWNKKKDSNKEDHHGTD